MSEGKSLDVFETLNALKTTTENMEKRLEKIETKIEQAPAYGAPPKYEVPAPKYPAGLYPIPKLKALVAKLAAQLDVPIEGTLKKFIDALGEESLGETKKESSSGVLPIPNQPNIEGQATLLAEKLRRR